MSRPFPRKTRTGTPGSPGSVATPRSRATAMSFEETSPDNDFTRWLARELQELECRFEQFTTPRSIVKSLRR